MIVATYGCLRRVETTMLCWENMSINRAGTMFMVSGLQRKKRVGAARPSTFAITDEKSVATLKMYYEAFPAAERKGRFFRKLMPDFRGAGHCRGSFRPVGINVIGKVPYFIALRLEIPHEQAVRYTGHAFRITGTVCEMK